MKKIGLLGGTFDPVHIGHVKIAESFASSAKIDELWILLTPFPPHKLMEDHVQYSSRLKMLRLAFQNHNFKILTIENELEKPSFTYRTIQYLKNEHPSYSFLFCMGEDSLAKFDTWKHHELILKEADLLVAKRPESAHSEVSGYILDKTHFVDHHQVDISSTEVRQRTDEPNFLKQVLPEDVHSYITSNNLYQK